MGMADRTRRKQCIDEKLVQTFRRAGRFFGGILHLLPSLKFQRVTAGGLVDTGGQRRLYDKIGKKAKAKIVFILDDSAICEVTDDGLAGK